jgi:hypothetical protein
LRKICAHIIFSSAKLSRVWLAIICFVFIGAQSLHAQVQPTRESTIKAVFLFNFSHFVEWPAHTFPGQAAPFVIGVLGEDPFGSYLDETVEGEKIDGHPLIVQRFRDAKDVKSCHILFISSKESERYKEILAELKGKNILTVSDNRAFTREGGIIRFSTEDNRIRLEINTDAAKKEELNISSKLLRIASIFDPNRH